MGANSIGEYWDDDGGSDGELRCAIESFCGMDSTAGVHIEEAYADVHDTEKTSSRKRTWDDPFMKTKSKACREKMRRDKLNGRFSQLSSVLNTRRPPKSDKASILTDAASVLTQLKTEAQELKESNEKLKVTIKDLKIEKNELRKEKMKLKADKEKLEHRIKAISLPPAHFMPHPLAYHPAAAPAASANVHAPSNKAARFAAYPGMGMWQWLPSAAIDTTKDTNLWPPNA
ncbi:transcription factor ILR3-like [Zingiber officinale]|uniref:BHLH domain-containing protein n=1 Tax=Zingiber officinale TaxID=94328 RepID=A0A8J5L477_ZINOF|nr:transcription factor ILR3-like [Zingiber officinale]KAG6505509.1 hypothetical protein ZIOFF_037865 [Zingiber officinale]